MHGSRVIYQDFFVHIIKASETVIAESSWCWKHRLFGSLLYIETIVLHPFMEQTDLGRFD